MRTSPTALDYRQRTLLKLETVLFIADGPEQAIALHPLFCRFRSPVHVVVTGARRGLTGKSLEDVLRSTECANAGSVFVHDLDLTTADDLAAASAAATETSRLIHALRPSVLIHVHRDQPMFHVLNSLARAEGLTAIGLPAGEIRHALWLSELSIKTLQRWHDVELDVVVITDRRPHSLSRLLQSTNSAYYLGDAVNLKLHLEQTADRVTRMLVNGYTWRHGKKIVRHRIQKGGLMPAIVESWYPSSDHNYAVLLEDDIEVSPLYYVWAKYSILKYRYSENATQLMYGISLYSPRHLELLPQGRRPFDPVQAIGDEYHARIPYLTQVPCSWGAVYFPEHWREFHGYLTSRLEDLRQYQLLNISVPNSRSQRWKKSWKKYFIELVYLRGYVMLYPNFQHFESFSTNHLEFGTHIKKERTNSLDEFLVPLMQRDTILSQLPGERLPDFDGLPVLDLWGQRVSHPLLESIGAEWHKNVSACPRAPLGRFDPQDLLCPFVRPTKKAKVVPKKTGEPHQAVEPLEYVTVYIDAVEPIQDDLAPKPIDISQMTTVESEITHEDDEFRDMAQDVERLVALAQTFTTTTTTITTTTTNPH
ncbi:hypothetical protein BCR43DRAFT_436945 [Syncephalastrum racemosum]|uniref:Uncharacterized protein n=1 Tax=Syncephalastrum racemosum TaxID=13706 RepID=A0A1X2HIV0_SYNRA|nr:hypothetical protein BCR43DRAFT_436945 [Syncephalastrum racemosum]